MYYFYARQIAILLGTNLNGFNVVSKTKNGKDLSTEKMSFVQLYKSLHIGETCLRNAVYTYFIQSYPRQYVRILSQYIL